MKIEDIEKSMKNEWRISQREGMKNADYLQTGDNIIHDHFLALTTALDRHELTMRRGIEMGTKRERVRSK